MQGVFAKIRYFRIFMGTFIGVILVSWLKIVNFGTFITLAIAAILFFGGYGIYLLLVKEPLIIEV